MSDEQNKLPQAEPEAVAPASQPDAADVVSGAEAEEGQELSAELLERLERIIEGLLLAADQPLSLDQLMRMLGEEFNIARKDLRTALAALANSLQGRACELQEVAGGFRLQVRTEYSEWVSRLWQERPPRLTRALLETLALIVYRQPITRGEIEEIRGVATNPNIVRTLFERGWIREVGVREVPGRPSLLGTTSQFLDDFNLKALSQLPSLPEIKDPEQLEAALMRLGAGRDADQAAGAVRSLAEEAAADEVEAAGDEADANPSDGQQTDPMAASAAMPDAAATDESPERAPERAQPTKSPE